MLNDYIESVWEHISDSSLYPVGLSTPNRLHNSIIVVHHAKKSHAVMAMLIGQALESLLHFSMPKHVFNAVCGIADHLRAQKTNKDKLEQLSQRFIERPMVLVEATIKQKLNSTLFDFQYRPLRTNLDNATLNLKEIDRRLSGTYTDMYGEETIDPLMTYERSLFGEPVSESNPRLIALKQLRSMTDSDAFIRVLLMPKTQEVFVRLFASQRQIVRHRISTIFCIPCRLLDNKEYFYFTRIFREAARTDHSANTELFDMALRTRNERTLSSKFICEVFYCHYSCQDAQASDAFCKKLATTLISVFNKDVVGFVRHLLLYQTSSISKINKVFANNLLSMWMLFVDHSPSIVEAEDALFTYAQLKLQAKRKHELIWTSIERPIICSKATCTFPESIVYTYFHREYLVRSNASFDLVRIAIQCGFISPYEALPSKTLNDEQVRYFMDLIE